MRGVEDAAEDVRAYWTASGYQGAATASGYQGAATASGTRGAATASGCACIAHADGIASRAAGAAGCAITLVERAKDDGRILAIFASLVGENGIEPDIFYELRDGKPVRVGA
jgi:hypothetical protein